jgi:hypothetical protein
MLSFFNSIYFVGCASFVGACVHAILSTKLALQIKNKQLGAKSKTMAAWLLAMLVGGFFLELYWASMGWLKLSLLPQLGHQPASLLIIRLTWIPFLVQHYALLQFIHSFIPQSWFSRLWRIITGAVTLLSSAYVLYSAISNFYVVDLPSRSLELSILSWIYVIVVSCLVPTLIYAIITSANKQLPVIFRRQLSIITYGLMLPYTVCELLSTNFFHGYVPALNNLIRSYTASGVASLLVAYLLYYCSKHMLSLRFLNLTSRVQAPSSYDFVAEFNSVLARLGEVDRLHELEMETREFFWKAFGIHPNRVHVGLMPTEGDLLPSQSSARAQSVLQKAELYFVRHMASLAQTRRTSFNDLPLNEHDTETHPSSVLSRLSALVRDELEFDRFNSGDVLAGQLLSLLDGMRADLFIPIHDYQQPLGYILVDHEPGAHKILNGVQIDQMVVYSKYISTIIMLLRTKNLQTLVHTNHQLKNALHARHQQVEFYKESVRTVLRDQTNTMIGLAFYSERKFLFATAEAALLLETTPLADVSEPQVREMRSIAHAARSSGKPQSTIITTTSGKELFCTAVADRDPSVAAIIIRPNRSLINFQQSLMVMKDPSSWDYLLYLETTQAGTRVKAALPGTSDLCKQLQHTILRICLNEPAALITAANVDSNDIAQVMHSLGQSRHMLSLELTEAEKDSNHAITLFGMNDLLEPRRHNGMLAQLEQTGLLLIENFHFLSLKTQDFLADMLTNGFYSPLCSNKKISCMTRIVCASPIPLQELMQTNRCSQKLAALLSNAHIAIPSLLTMGGADFADLVRGFEAQIHTYETTTKEKVALTDREHSYLLEHRPATIRELRQLVRSYLLEKMAPLHDDLILEEEIKPEQLTPEIMAILRQGKHALKDRQSLALLIQTFKNHAKVAKILGVNRSSVFRRCKEFNLE